MDTPHNNTHELLWTGGLDSTYRLLKIILNLKEPVQPHYIIDSPRKSTGQELKAITNILNLIDKKHPEARKLIKPMIITLDSDIPDIKHFKKVKAEFDNTFFRIGDQYSFLAAYANWKNYSNLEVSLERSTHTDNHTTDALAPNCEFCAQGNYWQLKGNYPNGLEVFHNIKLPLITTTKAEMLKDAKQEGFIDILSETWFCHRPIRNKPCGLCKPCKLAIKENIGWRIPKRTRIMAPYNKFIQSMKRKRKALKKVAYQKLNTL